MKLAIASTGQILDLASSEGDLLAMLQAWVAAEHNRNAYHRDQVKNVEVTCGARVLHQGITEEKIRAESDEHAGHVDRCDAPLPAKGRESPG